MSTDTLKQYLALRDALVKERATLTERLNRIKRALAGELSAVAAGARPKAARRFANKLSLRQAVITATSVKPLTKPEIMAAIRKLGYRFTAKDPMNSLNVILYTKGQFKNDGGRFSPAR